MATSLKYWREAATLILVSARKSGSGVKFTPVASQKPRSKGKGDNLDILMLKRSGKSSFMPNLYVFPGGVASDADFSSEWLDIYSQFGENVQSDLLKFVKGGKPGAPMFSRQREEQFSSVPSELAFRICAIRETFEESGVLIARKVPDVKNENNFLSSSTFGSAIRNVTNLDEWRRRVEGNADEFLTMCKKFDIVPDVWSLYEWSNWLTPAFEIIQHKKPKRFDTAFYLCCIEEKPEVAEDKGETVHSQWGSTLNILSESEKGTASIAPPQMYELSRFLHFSDLNHLANFTHGRYDERVPRYFPVRFQCSDALLFLMPGDDLYPEEPDLFGGGKALSSDLTLAELNEKYPRMHRTMWVADGTKRIGRVMCNIEMEGKHIPPYVDFPSLFPDDPESKL